MNGGCGGELTGAALRGRLAANLAEVQGRITATAKKVGRDPQAIRIIAVTKTVGAAEASILHDLGVGHMGENRLEHASEVMAACPQDIVWHMIAPLQRRKVRDAVERFDSFDSVDRISLAEELQKRCEAAGKRVRILLEVNVSGEEAKHGFAPADLAPVIEQIGSLDALDLQGLMTMAPFVSDPEQTRPVFRELRSLAQKYGLPQLSMGMSNDYKVAVEEGATEVRIGSALFVNNCIE